MAAACMMFQMTNLKKKKKIYFWLHGVLVAAHGLSLVAASRGRQLVVVHKLLVAVASPVADHRLQGLAFSSCGVGLVAPRHAGSSWTRGWQGPMSHALGCGFLITGPRGKSE